MWPLTFNLSKTYNTQLWYFRVNMMIWVIRWIQTRLKTWALHQFKYLKTLGFRFFYLLMSQHFKDMSHENMDGISEPGSQLIELFETTQAEWPQNDIRYTMSDTWYTIQNSQWGAECDARLFKAMRFKPVPDEFVVST